MQSREFEVFPPMSNLIKPSSTYLNTFTATSFKDNDARPRGWRALMHICLLSTPALWARSGSDGAAQLTVGPQAATRAHQVPHGSGTSDTNCLSNSRGESSVP